MAGGIFARHKRAVHRAISIRIHIGHIDGHAAYDFRMMVEPPVYFYVFLHCGKNTVVVILLVLKPKQSAFLAECPCHHETKQYD